MDDARMTSTTIHAHYNDYKYKKAQTLIKKTGNDKIDDSIKYIYKIEKKLVESTYNQENSKRFIIAMKQKLQA